MGSIRRSVFSGGTLWRRRGPGSNLVSRQGRTSAIGSCTLLVRWGVLLSQERSFSPKSQPVKSVLRLLFVDWSAMSRPSRKSFLVLTLRTLALLYRNRRHCAAVALAVWLAGWRSLSPSPNHIPAAVHTVITSLALTTKENLSTSLMIC